MTSELGVASCLETVTRWLTSSAERCSDIYRPVVSLIHHHTPTMKVPADYPPMSPYITVKDAARAIDFYIAAFGAKEVFRLKDSASGAIGHAEILVNGSLLMLSEENPAWGNRSPQSLGGTPV